MSTLSPKKQQIQEREAQILEHARPMIVRDGYHGLNMDRIAEAVNASKGTIYNHFSCKEEIVIALAIQNMKKRIGLFRRAAEFKACSRFRMNAIGVAAEVFVKNYSEYFQFEQILQLDSVREKTSEKRQAVIQNNEMQCMSIVAGIVRDAVAADDMALPATVGPEGLVFGLWALTSGAYSIAMSSQSLPQLGVEDPFLAVREHVSAMLDGYQWQPLSSSYDLDELVGRIEKEVFEDEF